MLTSRPLLLPNLPHDLHEMDPGDERLLLRKEKRITISPFVCSHELPPFVRYVIFSIMVPRILPYLNSWQCKRFRRGCQGHREFFLLRRGVTIIITIIIIITTISIIIIIIIIIISIIIIIIIIIIITIYLFLRDVSCSWLMVHFTC